MTPLFKQILVVVIAFVGFGIIGRVAKNKWLAGMGILLLAGYAGWLVHKYEVEKKVVLIIK